MNLLKGAIRRVFSRSELRRKVVDTSVVAGYVDPNRPRVKKWSRCQQCKKLEPTYLMDVDHIEPVIPLSIPFEHLTVDTVVNRLWCEENNLQVLCVACHDAKSKQEQKIRLAYKKTIKQTSKRSRTKNESKTSKTAA